MADVKLWLGVNSPMKWISVGLLILLLLLQIRLWMGEGSIKEVLGLKQAIEQQEIAVTGLQERNQRLAAEVKDLKHQLGALEELARTDLGMIKQGETFYQFAETSNPTPENMSTTKSMSGKRLNEKR